jgi:phosphatidylglycerol---prolipoprotein diacylglyceryl transferase
MTVYPFVVHVGRFTLTGYGLMLMGAFLVAGWVFASELAHAGLDTALAWDSVVCAVIGGLVGGKIYYALLVHDWSALTSRGGLVWYGGFVGGFSAVVGYLWWKRQPLLRMGDFVAPALAAGYAVGRVGCFLVGDDYGVPTHVPWAVAFPQGSPPSTARVLAQEFHVVIPQGTSPDAVLAVHPTQLYEVAIALAAFALLVRLRDNRFGAGWRSGVYLALAGMARMFVEIFRAKDDRVLGAFTLAQGFSVLVVAAGAWLMLRAQRAHGPQNAEKVRLTG